MTVWIDMDEDYTFDFPIQETAELVMATLLNQEAFPYEAEVNILLTDYDRIRELNREFRNIDRETDVLSFPAIDFLSPADYTVIDADPEIYSNPDTDEVILGDIMICVPRLREQAREYGHGEKREYAFLIAHSILHLLGYDHMEEDQTRDMEQRQELALQRLHITR